MGGWVDRDGWRMFGNRDDCFSNNRRNTRAGYDIRTGGRGEGGGQEDFINGIESSGTIHREARIIGIPVAIESKAMVPFFHRGVCVYISAPQVCTRCTRSSTSTRAISCVE